MKANVQIEQLSAQINQDAGVKLNRAQRRATKRTTNPKVCRKVMNAGMLLLDRARPYDPGEMVAEHILTREAFGRLIDGSGAEDDFDRLAMQINVGMIRAESIDSGLLQTMRTGQDAFVRMRESYQESGSFSFDGSGLDDAANALDAYEAVLDASSPLQMLAAIREAYKRITSGQLLDFPT